MDNPVEAVKGLKGNQKKVVIFGGIAAVGYIAYRWMNKGSSGSDNTPATTGGTDAPVAEGTAGSNVGGSENVGNSGNNGTTITTNDVWYDTAVTRLANAGWDSATVQSALGDFVTGQKLTEDEAKIVRAAVGAMGGYPPNGPTTITVIPGVTDASKLAAPTGLKVTAHTDTTATLTWNAVTGAKQYRVYRSGAAQNVGGSTDTTAVISGLQPGTKYTLYVAAGVDGEKMGPRSSGVTVTTGSTKLKAPSGLHVTSKTATSVSLAWNPTYPGQYLIQQSGHSGYSESVNASQRITGLQPNHRYSFRVAASQPTSKTPGPWSSYISVTTNKK